MNEPSPAEQNKSIRAYFLSQAIWNANEFSIFPSSRLYGNEKKRAEIKNHRKASEDIDQALAEASNLCSEAVRKIRREIN